MAGCFRPLDPLQLLPKNECQRVIMHIYTIYRSDHDLSFYNTDIYWSSNLYQVTSKNKSMMQLASSTLAMPGLLSMDVNIEYSL